MARGPVRLLFVGDIHLGRRPTRLPEALAEHGVDPAELTPAAGFARAVERALREPVDAVVLAGDVVERVEDRFEAYGHLQSGVARLAAEEIPVLGVAGNHDVEALPRLARQVEGFRLLGAGGRWETAEIEGRAGGRVRLLGWSFPEQRVTTSPLRSLREPPRDEDAPLLGVLHCDLDQSTSAYAPVARAELEATGADAWLLGHVHAPAGLSERRPIGYLGSLVGLHPGEPGPHGPWLVEAGGGEPVRARQLPLAPLRYEREDVPVGAIDAEGREDLADALQAAAGEAFERVHARLGGGAAHCRAVACRLRLTGRSARHAELADAAASLRTLAPEIEGVRYWVERVEDRAEPALDWEALCAGEDPPALLARRLRALAAGGPEADALVREALATAERAPDAPRWHPGTDAAAERAMREALLASGTRALEALLGQRPRSGEGAP